MGDSEISKYLGLFIFISLILFGCSHKVVSKYPPNLSLSSVIIEANFNQSTGLEQSWFIPVQDSGSIFEAKFKAGSPLSFVGAGTITQVVQNGAITVIIQSLDFTDQTIAYYSLVQNPNDAFLFKGKHVAKGEIFGLSTGGLIRSQMNLSKYDSNLIISVANSKGVAQDFSGVFPLVQ